MIDEPENEDRWEPPRRHVPALEVSEQNITDFWRLFVNRRAYTRQSDRPSTKNGKFFYYPPKDRRAEGHPRLPLDWPAVRRHLAGWQTIGLYAIQPETQKSKWVAIDADYSRAHFDLKNLKEELREDGVEALEESSRRGGHLWILGSEPLPSRECKIYIYNLALSLGVPIKRSGDEDGIEVFPRQEELGPGKFGNQIRGPLGIHRATLKRYWFYGAEQTLDDQLAYLKAARKLTPEALHRFTAGMRLPEEFIRPKMMETPSCCSDGAGFRILDYVAVTTKESSDYRAQCPSCGPGNDPKRHHLAVSVAEPWKYRCWYGCTKEMIRAAVGKPISDKRQGEPYAPQRA